MKIPIVPFLVLNTFNQLIVSVFCGAGGIRTLVQTSNTQAFYMLILLFIFDLKQRANTQFQAYLLEFSSFGQSPQRLISAFPMPQTRSPQNGAAVRHLVSLLYFGKNAYPTMLRIKQQEQTLRCQLKSCSKGLKRSRYGSLHAYLPIDLAVETSQPHRKSLQS